MASLVEPSRVGGLAPPVPENLQPGSRNARYSAVAIILHWLIAAMIIFNLSIGYFMEGFAPPFRAIALILHLSAGMTVLALTVLRVIWRLLHEPPAYPSEMKSWEQHAAHFAHFLLYCGMVLMPLTGWAILSAHPPPGSPGAAAKMAAMLHGPLVGTAGVPVRLPLADVQGSVAPRAGEKPEGVMPSASARTPVTSVAAAPPRRPPPTPKIWFVIPVPAIAPIQMIGAKPGGVPAQDRLHKQFVTWHGLGGWLMIALLLLHVIGALKHQLIDKQQELQRMGLGRRRH